MRAVLTLLLLALPLSAFAADPASVPLEKRSRWATSVKQDANLYRIDDKLYCSEQPVADDGDAIEKLGIKSVINLRYFDRNDNDTHLKNRGLTLLNRPLRSWRIKPEDIAQTLYLIEKQQQQGAVLIHCYHGADRTGLISGMYRIIYQGWTVADAKEEMLHGPYGYHSIWKNIANLFTEKTVKQVRQHLAELRRGQK